MKLISTVFGDRNITPPRYTCDGQDVSPPISWWGRPANIQSLALIVEYHSAKDMEVSRGNNR